MAGIVLTGNLRPNADVLRLIAKMPFPVLLAADDSYKVASKVHDLIVKITSPFMLDVLAGDVCHRANSPLNYGRGRRSAVVAERLARAGRTDC